MHSISYHVSRCRREVHGLSMSVPAAAYSVAQTSTTQWLNFPLLLLYPAVRWCNLYDHLWPPPQVPSRSLASIQLPSISLLQHSLLFGCHTKEEVKTDIFPHFTSLLNQSTGRQMGQAKFVSCNTKLPLDVYRFHQPLS